MIYIQNRQLTAVKSNTMQKLHTIIKKTEDIVPLFTEKMWLCA